MSEACLEKGLENNIFNQTTFFLFCTFLGCVLWWFVCASLKQLSKSFLLTKHFLPGRKHWFEWERLVLYVCLLYGLSSFNPGPLFKLYCSALKLEHFIRNQHILVSKVLSVYWKHPLAVPLAADESASLIKSECHTPELPSQAGW